jgi:ribosome-associated protein
MNLAQTGGQAGLLVVDGLVKLNGNQESRKRAKIRSGDVITIDNIKILVK